jgi:hypothetical protein
MAVVLAFCDKPTHSVLITCNEPSFCFERSHGSLLHSAHANPFATPTGTIQPRCVTAKPLVHLFQQPPIPRIRIPSPCRLVSDVRFLRFRCPSSLRTRGELFLPSKHQRSITIGCSWTNVDPPSARWSIPVSAYKSNSSSYVHMPDLCRPPCGYANPIPRRRASARRPGRHSTNHASVVVFLTERPHRSLRQATGTTSTDAVSRCHRRRLGPAIRRYRLRAKVQAGFSRP